MLKMGWIIKIKAQLIKTKKSQLKCHGYQKLTKPCKFVWQIKDSPRQLQSSVEDKNKHPPLLLIKKPLSRLINSSDKLASVSCYVDATTLTFWQQFHGAGSSHCNFTDLSASTETLQPRQLVVGKRLHPVCTACLSLDVSLKWSAS